MEKIYILLEDAERKDNLPDIIQRGKPLRIVHSADSITEDIPCYIFDKIEVQGDSAYIRVTFDITGTIALGNLNYINGHWVPDKEFKVGVR
jgi:hypothetical protein